METTLSSSSGSPLVPVRMRVLSSLTAVNLNISVWSGRKKLTREDVGNADLPPADLASLGSKRMCNPDDLKVFGTLRQRAYTLLDKHGVRFLGGWAIPNDKAQLVADELRSIRLDFENERDAYMERYEDAIQEWIAAHAEWSNIFTDSAVSADYVRSRLGFRWQFYRVEAATAAQPEMEEAIGELGGQLFGELSQMASQAWEQFKGRSEIHQRTLNMLRTIRSKVLGLSFLDYRAMPVVKLVDNVLGQCPDTGSITGGPLMAVQALVFMMKDAAALLAHAQCVAEGRTTASVIDELLAVPDPNLVMAPPSSGDDEAAIDLLPNTQLSDLLLADSLPMPPSPSDSAPVPPVVSPNAPSTTLGLW